MTTSEKKGNTITVFFRNKVTITARGNCISHKHHNQKVKVGKKGDEKTSEIYRKKLKRSTENILSIE